MDYKIRLATRKELDIIVDWAAKEGWNPGLYDADAFFATDPKGYYLGLLGKEPISSISAVSYDKSFGFLGFYIVKPEYRSKGYGVKIWNEALRHLPTQNIGLDGVVAQQENYKKSGFKLAYRNIRYEGVGTNNQRDWTDMVLLSKIPFEKLVEYDRRFFPTKREKFLRKWIKQPKSLAIGQLKGKDLVGYGMFRKCRNGFKVGPLFAESEQIADMLFQNIRSSVGPKNSIYLDTPEVNKKAIKLAERNDMKPMFETARMYTKKEPKVPINKIFGVTTFELG